MIKIDENKIKDTTDFIVKPMLDDPSAIMGHLFWIDLERIKEKLSYAEIKEVKRCVDNNLKVYPSAKKKEWLAYMQLYKIMEEITCSVYKPVYNAVRRALKKNKIKAMAIMERLEEKR